MSLRQFGFDRDRLSRIFQGIILSSLVKSGMTAVTESFRKPIIESQRLGVIIHCRIQQTQAMIGKTTIEIYSSILRVKANRLVKILNRCCVMSLLIFLGARLNK